ncbi:261_t:CDS:2 [Acaulospora colombiana]|uniref:261_t:CDS:1 n=1 Tax=Acaulospora colombiana TaxID=27376 RepID=A0ACA9P4A8_9GLOM|nr:261_t:CDS:2 [Acaulospora colombiana]
MPDVEVQRIDAVAIPGSAWQGSTFEDPSSVIEHFYSKYALPNEKLNTKGADPFVTDPKGDGANSRKKGAASANNRR